jgi:hypothetical protein
MPHDCNRPRIHRCFVDNHIERDSSFSKKRVVVDSAMESKQYPSADARRLIYDTFILINESLLRIGPSAVILRVIGYH